MAQVAFLVIALVLLAFSWGATVAWRLETRRPLVSPLWLVITRNTSWVVFVAYLVVTGEPPTGIVAVEPLIWNLLETFMVVAALAVFVLELRHTLRNREPA